MKTFLTVLLLACAAHAYAQAPAQPAQPDKAKAEAAAPQKKAPRAKAAPAPAAAQAPAPAQPAPKKAPPAAAKADQDAEESVVMIDSKAEIEETGRFAASAAEQDDQPAVPGGLPSSYGQLKGVVNEAGRSLLVFESPDDGTITFVQVNAGKSGVSWKLVDRIPRSQD